MQHGITARIGMAAGAIVLLAFVAACSSGSSDGPDVVEDIEPGGNWDLMHVINPEKSDCPITLTTNLVDLSYTIDDPIRPHAYHYRDYVIAAMNEDIPFDRFIREQLAGDEMIGYPKQNPQFGAS